MQGIPKKSWQRKPLKFNGHGLTPQSLDQYEVRKCFKSWPLDGLVPIVVEDQYQLRSSINNNQGFELRTTNTIDRQ